MEAAFPQVTNTASVSVSADNNPANDVASIAAEVRRVSPVIFALEPPAAIAGSSGMGLKVRGSNFVPGTTVQWNGVARQTTFLSESELQADVGAGDLASPGRNPVTVVNPPGAGGVSNSKDFVVFRSRCPGDANGDSIRDLLDISRVVRHALNIQSLTAQQVADTDLDANGSVDVADLVRLIRHLLETSRLPDCR